MGPRALERKRLVPDTVVADRYRIVRTVGIGATGSVVQALDSVLDDRVVALKLLHPHLIVDHSAFARFRNEVLVTRELAHANIMRVYDIGSTAEGQCFISMEFIEGQSLANRLRQEPPLRFDESLVILEAIARGVAHAHDRGVIHRDLKPDNIMLSVAGDVKVTDFGIARALWQNPATSKIGPLLGTPHYMSPEQLTGASASPKSDVYALGILAFHLTTGRPPFDDDSLFNLAEMHLEQELPTLSGPFGPVPRWFDELVRQAAAKDPEVRLASASEFADLLRRHRASSDPAPRRQLLRAATSIRATVGRIVRVRRLAAIAVVLGGIVACAVILAARSFDSVRARVAVPLLATEHYLSPQWTKPLKALIEVPVALDDLGALDRAVRIRRTDLVFALVHAGADRAARNEQGRTALHRAVSILDPQMVQLLLAPGWFGESELAVNDRDLNGETPLHLAARLDQGAIVRLLLDAGAQTEQENARGSTPLHLAAGRNAVTAIAQLLQNHASVTASNDRGSTPLSMAVRSGSTHGLRLLLRESPPPVLLARNQAMQTLLHEALLLDADTNPQTVEELVRQLLGSEVGSELAELPDADGVTPLMYAVRRGQQPLVDALVQTAARLDAQDAGGRTVLVHAIEAGNSAIVRQLLALPQVRRGLLSVADRKGELPLQYAVRGGSLELVNLLLKTLEAEDALATIESADQAGVTALMRAAEVGDRALVHLLMLYGAKPKATDKTGRTALQYADARFQQILAPLLNGR
ncbi:MAG: ankyrin repeat domain-containing protein [Bdellovibrionales bacterium]|nr:ankyrin repeat domain-containing protein [Bdellovibrionales bacterium]